MSMYSMSEMCWFLSDGFLDGSLLMRFVISEDVIGISDLLLDDVDVDAAADDDFDVDSADIADAVESVS
jgi:hypothetical protein